MATDKITIKAGSRKSQLALIQTHYVISLLQQKFPDNNFEVVSMSTTGDNILDTPLSKIGEKSLFTKELERALYEKEVQFVVHSLKDLPTTLPHNMCIAAVLKREDPHDAVVMHIKHDSEMTLGRLPPKSLIGTSSLRRSSQLKRKYPHLEFESIRGNLNTRLHKLDGADTYSGIVLAAAGLKRMGWGKRISQILDPEECMYAISQGALGIECRTDDEETRRMLQTLNHRESIICCVAERSFLKTLEGGCSVPVACETILDNSNLYMKGGIFSIDGEKACMDSMDVNLPKEDGEPSAKKMDYSPSQETSKPSGEVVEFAGIVSITEVEAILEKASQLGNELAEKMLSGEGRDILREAKEQTDVEINRRKEEWKQSKLNPDAVPKSKQNPMVVESLKLLDPPKANCDEPIPSSSSK